MTRILLALVRAYQLALSPFLGRSCRFHPSCSQYAIEAIHRHGPARGSLLAARRICRCHPWHPGGYDPVPPGGRGHPPAGAGDPQGTAGGDAAETRADGAGGTRHAGDPKHSGQYGSMRRRRQATEFFRFLPFS